MDNAAILIGAPQLPPEAEAKVEAAIAAIKAVADIKDGPVMFTAMAVLQIRATVILADPMMQLGCTALRHQGRLRIPGVPD